MMFGRSLDLVQTQISEMDLRVRLVRAEERISALDRVTDEKFVRLGVVVAAEAERVRLALDATQKAIDKAERATEKAAEALATDVKSRFAHVNELRGALADNQATNVTRLEFDQFRAHYTEQHALLRDQNAELIGELKERLDRAEGRSGGVSGAWGVIVAVVGIAIAIGALVFRNM